LKNAIDLISFNDRYFVVFEDGVVGVYSSTATGTIID